MIHARVYLTTKFPPAVDRNSWILQQEGVFFGPFVMEGEIQTGTFRPLKNPSFGKHRVSCVLWKLATLTKNAAA